MFINIFLRIPILLNDSDFLSILILYWIYVCYKVFLKPAAIMPCYFTHACTYTPQTYHFFGIIIHYHQFLITESNMFLFKSNIRR